MVPCVLEEKGKTGVESTLFEEMKSLKEVHDHSGGKKTLNSELWHACAGPLVSLPQVTGLVYYFPQGHSEQVAVSTKRTGTSYIPSYPNPPSQIMCWVHNVKLHTDKETDEIYAQTLQPVNTEKDVFPTPGFGPKPSKHPSEFFCKTLNASDTSTHGGFSVPRRATEKLFPRLYYATSKSKLVVRDLHDNTWTFRHIYRGQPKRHLLTTEWSLFVGAKRLRAGDFVLFIRDKTSQLLVGVKRANRQQAALPLSVLTAESMHIGVLAAAAHAFANRSQFTIFYNPRACPSEFVIPLAKYQKTLYSTKVSIEMRFGMMFETEESGKRRCNYSKSEAWKIDQNTMQNLHIGILFRVEWDEPGCGEHQNRISLWDMESPESLFIFPSLTACLKRLAVREYIYVGEQSCQDNKKINSTTSFFHKNPAATRRGAENELGNLIREPYIQFPNGNNDLLYRQTPVLASEQLKPQIESLPACVINGIPLQEGHGVPQSLSSKINHILPSQNYSMQNHKRPKNIFSQLQALDSSKVDDELPPIVPIEKPETTFSTPHNLINQLTVLDEMSHIETGPRLEPHTVQSHEIKVPQLETSNFNYFSPNPNNLPSQFFDTDDWMLQPSTWLSFPKGHKSAVNQEMVSSMLPSFGQEICEPLTPFKLMGTQQDQHIVQNISSSCGIRDIYEESNDQREIYNGNQFEVRHEGNNIVHTSVSKGLLDSFTALGEAGFRNPSDYLIEFTDNSGGTSSSNVDFDESSLLQQGSWQQVPPPLRTYTKVQKLGSVGRSIDVTRFTNYNELRSAIACMFGLEKVLDDPRSSGWRLVYVDFENDVLLVGDDPWEEFVSCVWCIRVLSPIEAQQMTLKMKCIYFKTL
ncbi:hypothetical protein GIB67_009128 [Kingdonia uniflora]|uniref:Auxin response factor n=1 Tax=Kingdonia uniflora TaxID=39325 RepID=A0A7J7N217_9MAGN|nr:hypothetical protein GIB67_009128 [Kingdonia uniflora]